MTRLLAAVLPSILVLLLLGGNAQAQEECTLSQPAVLYNEGSKSLTLEQVANDAEGTFTMRLTYVGGNAWVGVGVNKEGTIGMIPGTAIIGRAHEDEFDINTMDDVPTSVKRYDLKNDKKDASGIIAFDDDLQDMVLRDATFEQPDENTSILTFTHLINDGMIEITNESMWIFAVGLPDNKWEGKHNIRGHFRMPLLSNCGAGAAASATALVPKVKFFDADPTTKFLWILHGTVLSVAWGVFVPLGVGASLVRSGIVKYITPNDEGFWFKLHFFFNMSAVILTVVGFAIAVLNISSANGTHFEGLHPVIGLIVFCACILQGLMGYFRPSLPKKKPATKEEATHTKTNDPETNSATNAEGSDDEHHHHNSNGNPCGDEEKSLTRVIWEYGHRLFGVALLALAWFNCHTGMEEIGEKYVGLLDMTWFFWVVTGVISFALVVMACVLRLFGGN